MAEGWNAVVWSERMSAFPYLKGMSAIALSWLFSPILAAVSAFLLFGAIRTFVLRSDNAYKRSLVLLPVFVFLTFFVVTWFIIARWVRGACMRLDWVVGGDTRQGPASTHAGTVWQPLPAGICV